MSKDLFDVAQMEELLSQLNEANQAKQDTSDSLGAGAMSKEMEASQRRYEEYIKKHAE